MTNAWTGDSPGAGKLPLVDAVRGYAGQGLKRTLDLTVALVALVLLSPLLLAVYVAVRVTSPGAGFFRQTRVGLNQRSFSMYKFRTMREGCDQTVHRDYVLRLLAEDVEAEGGLYKLEDDFRVTRLGSWLRRTSIDELPQLFNVIRGDMSLVGPRPALAWEVENFPGWAMTRFTVRPGLTGLWQVSGRSRLTMLQGLRLDAVYVVRRTFWFDLVILLRTVPAVLGRGAR